MRQRFFSLRQPILQLGLFDAQAIICFPLQVKHSGKRSGVTTTATNAGKIGSSTEVVQGVDHQVTVIGKWLGNTLAQKLGDLNPEPIAENIGVGKDHNIDHVAGAGQVLFCRCFLRRGFLGSCIRHFFSRVAIRRVGFFSSISNLFHHNRATIRERAIDYTTNAGSNNEALVRRFKLVE